MSEEKNRVQQMLNEKTDPVTSVPQEQKLCARGKKQIQALVNRQVQQVKKQFDRFNKYWNFNHQNITRIQKYHQKILADIPFYLQSMKYSGEINFKQREIEVKPPTTDAEIKRIQSCIARRLMRQMIGKDKKIRKANKFRPQ